MSKECVKCGYIRQAADDAPDYECPKCGVIYAKAEAALANGTLVTSRLRARVVQPDPETIPSKLVDNPASLIGSSGDEDLSPIASVEYSEEVAVPPFSKVLGIIGSLVLFLGVFAPIIRLPIVGSMNYFRNGAGDGVILIAMAILSLFFVFRNQPAKLFWTASASIATLTFTFVYFNWKMHEMKSEMDKSLAGNPFRGLAELAQNSIQIEWGWIVLVLGAGLLFMSALTHKFQIYSFDELLRVVSPRHGSAESPMQHGGSTSVPSSSKSASTVTGGPSVADELMKLNELLKVGAISSEEFNQLKAKLLK